MLSFLFFILILMIGLSFLAGKRDRPMLYFFCFTYVFYILGGYYYWQFEVGTYFTGLIWGSEVLDWAFMVFAVSILIAFSTIMLLSRIISYKIYLDKKSVWNSKYYNVSLFLGMISSLYVYANVLIGNPISKGGIGLIAYQLSDILIAVVVFGFAANKNIKINALLLIYFTLYAVAIGFRYKLASVFIPLLLMYYYKDSGLRGVKSKLLTILMVPAVLFLFTAMTLLRTKFSGVDFSQINDVSDKNSMLYGLLAETNVVFALAATISEYADKHHYVYFAPVIATIQEYVPRFFFSEKNTGAYLEPMFLGFGTEEGYQSGTAPPFCAEYIAMFGYYGVIVGPIVYGFLYIKLSRIYFSISNGNKKVFLGALGMLIFYFGYYNLGRGYMPQMSKYFLFVLLPYYLMCKPFRVRLKHES